MKKIFILLFVMFSLQLFSTELSNIDPSFYNYSARAISMGNAYCAQSGEPVLAFWNPAGIISKSPYVFSFTSANVIDLISYNYVGISKKIDHEMSVATNIIYSGDDAYHEYSCYFSVAFSNKKIKKRLPATLQKFSFFDKAIWGMSIKYLGATFGNNSNGELLDSEGFNHQVSGSANGFGFDFGVQSPIGKNSKIGILWRNPINEIFWNSENEVGTALGDYREGQPSQFVFGYNYKNKKIVWNLDLSKSYHLDTEDVFSTGIEYNLFNIIPIRTGYSQELLTGDNRKYSFGSGYHLKLWNKLNFKIDVAYEIQTEWKGSNSFVLSGALFY